MGAVISFFRPATTCRGGWSQQELAEFYRVEAALIRAGLQIGSAQGLSDEADPWFVFCRPDGDAIMHFARIDGSYVIASEVLDSPMRGSDFRTLIDEIARRYPELLPIPQDAGGTKLSVHPAALLAALVAAAALSLSPDDARADDGERSTASAPQAPHAGQAHQHGPSEARDTGDADERDTHRKQVGIIVFSAMVFAADAFVDHPAHGIEATSYLGAPGGISAFPGDQGSVSPTTGGAASPVHTGGPLGSSRHEGPTSGASGFVTAEPPSVVSARSDIADFGLIGLRDPASAPGPARTGPEPAFQPLARGAEASAARAAGSSSAPDAGSDGSAATSGDASAREPAGPSSTTTGEAASQAPSAAPATGHAASEAPPAQVNGLNPTTQPGLKHALLTTGEERSGSPDNGARAGAIPEAAGQRSAIGGADPSGAGTGAPEREQHGATAVASLHPSVSIAQMQVDAADPDRAQAGEGPVRSAEAPGHLKEAAAGLRVSAGHGVAGSANPDQPSGIAQALPSQTQIDIGAGRSAEAPGHLREAGSGLPDPSSPNPTDSVSPAPAAGVAQAHANSADQRHAQSGEEPGRSGEALGHLHGSGVRSQDASAQGTGSSADLAPPSVSVQARASSADAGHGQPSEGPGRKAEAPGHLQDTGRHAQDADSHGTAATPDQAAPAPAASVEASLTDPGHLQVGEGPGRSAEAPGHSQNTAPHAQDSGGPGTDTGAAPSPLSANAPAQASADGPDHARAAEGPGRSIEAPGHFEDTEPHRQGAGGHNPPATADPTPPPGHAQPPASAADPDHAQAAEGPGRSAAAPAPLQEARPHPQNLDGASTASETNAGTSPGVAQGQAVEADPSQRHFDNRPDDPAHGNAGGTASVIPPATPNQPIAHQDSAVSTEVSRDRAPSAEPISPVSGSSHSPRPPATVDPNGDIVFSSDHKAGPSAGPSHAPPDGGTHDGVGLIGISDHSTSAHHFDLHG
ncbi:hypothetical protein R1A27_30225 (plasmid) [Methylobacterium sp. NMS12]|uniref:hypothetical protein n=1 Tax=Methylobacterium sp. NMS12 TaxID=3079766 RepID=UPI003F882622